MQRKTWILVTVFAVVIDSRRVRLKSAVSTEEPEAQTPRQVLFYAEEPSQSEEDAPVIIARQPSYSRAVNPTLVPRARTPETPKAPPVQTIRNYNKINDDGSFTFGYEAADGSFKEETRGTDCVVRGKYGYIDPDGNKREFTYVSGNPCDPNSVSQEEEDELKDKSNEEEENIPANLPRRPNFAARPQSKSRPTTTLFQQSFNNEDNGIEEDNNQLVEIRQPLRPSVRPNTQEEQQIFRSTARPVTRTSASTRFSTKQSTDQPATTYRPQIVQFSATPSPVTSLPRATKGPFIPSSTVAPAYFDDQFKRFQLESNVIPSQSSLPKAISSNPIYSTELVYDPQSGQYNTIVYQQVPKFSSDVNINQRLPAFVPQPQPSLQPVTAPRLLTSSTTQSPFFQQQQQLIQQQQQAALVQQSQQLYNQQLRQQQLQLQQQQQRPLSTPLPQTVLLKQNPQRFPQPIVQRFPPETKSLPIQEPPFQQQPLPFYFVNPTVPDQRQNLANGQIEAFLRGHNLPF